MATHSAGKARPKTALWRIGLWATIWWGVSCVYALFLVWQSKDFYINNASGSGPMHFSADWWSALRATYLANALWPVSFALIAIVWGLGGWLWVRELDRQHISRRAALKDLFLTIRK